MGVQILIALSVSNKKWGASTNHFMRKILLADEKLKIPKYEIFGVRGRKLKGVEIRGRRKLNGIKYYCSAYIPIFLHSRCNHGQFQRLTNYC